MQRRQFLHLTTTTALATALPALAAPRPPKKLALLIGINSYPHKTIPNLKGCLNDIELQRALLIDRLGFQPQDILTLTNQQATRAAIIQTIETHLIQQAQPNDIIIIHFSGHGTRVQDPDPITDDGLNGAIAPYDYGDPQAESVNAIMGKTLHLLLTALPTDNVTTILDCCHAEGGLRGDSVTRSIDHLRSPGNHPTTSEADRADQTRWLKTLGWTPQDLQTSRKKGHAKGIGLGSTGRNQLAADAPFDDFHAGAFTYLLTRALWQTDTTTTTRQLFDKLAESTRTLAQSARIFQNPTYSLPPGQKALADRPPYFITSNRPAAEGAIRPSSTKELEFWLGGIAPQALPAFNQGAQFAIIDDRGRTIGELEQTRRSGLIGYGKLKTGKLPTQLNPLLRETIRGVPANLSLRLGLTPSLQSATASITQALEPLGRIQITPDNIDLWLTQTPERKLGLLQPDLLPLPTTFGPPAETPASAIQRLRPQLQSLLARRMLHTLAQNTTQGLKLNARAYDPNGSGGSSRSFPAGRQIAIQVTNPNHQPLHIALLAIDSDGILSILHPTDWETLSPPPLSPKQTITLPDPSGPFRFILVPPAGFLEVLVLGSTQPLQDALKGLRQIARTTNTRSGNPLTLQGDQPLEVTTQLFQSMSRLYTNREQSTIYDVDNRQLTSLSLTIEVTEPM